MINNNRAFRYQLFSNNIDNFKIGEKIKKEEVFKVNLIKIAHKNLNDPILYPYFKKDLINFPDFYFLYKFMELSYFLSLDRKLGKDDIEILYFSGLDEIIIQKMEHFDEDFKIFQINDDFFIRLKNLKWHNKDTERFFLKLNNAKTEILYDLNIFSDEDIPLSSRDFPSDFATYTPSKMINTFPPLYKRAYFSYFTGASNRSIYPINPINLIFMPFENPYLNFSATEKAFILFLAGCSALNNNQDTINVNDIIKAYKVHYKLLTTDISKLIDELWEEISKENTGYLGCEKCNNYYKLQPGESPEDFTDECECGGKLEYHEDIDWLLI